MQIAATEGLLGPQELILLRAEPLELPDQGGAVGLRVLAASLPGDPASELLLASALCAAMLAVASRYAAQEEGAFGRARHGEAVQVAGLSGAALHDGDDARLVALLIARALGSNPALSPLHGLWSFSSSPQAGAQVERAATWLAAEEPPLRDLGPLPAVFAAPAEAALDAQGQLAFLRQEWADLLPPTLLVSIGRVVGTLAEEARARGTGGPGPVQGPGVEGPEMGGAVEDDATTVFTEDRDWMPSLVLIAKQAFVWLHQLSRDYGVSVTTLDQVPDAELDRLVAQGFTGLWLIGLWERSTASRVIKRRMGNPEAEASAYALHDYAIAQRLGGEGAWKNLSERAAARGLRLASDMVPNHVGIDGRWLVEHPEWFVQVPHPPYPGYSFSGPDLSEDESVGIYLEDGYWDQSDAAVVFKRVAHDTGEARYVYHGNDGTQMPWNDTAQLDYLNPVVREAVIQQILAVARRFPIIRFDAAMTLARRHVQRLWHPTPGAAGAVPSRAQYGASPEEFALGMPQEFWREVVQRVQEEVPDTLLLAEAFWMMEGYFVRNLGMHRVYNSAFMHMLRDEDNAGFRGMIRDILAVSPAILERFVNFVNNPDEESAASQFGTSDKYFGVATLMATLPGLPMFGHGQIEGYTEKYGMEYARAYTDETPDPGFVAHHEAVILPLLRRREEFCTAAQFALLDLETIDGVDEHVIAYCNRSGSARSLVVFNNRWSETRGRLGAGVLGDALGLDPSRMYGLQDQQSQQWTVSAGRDLTAGLDLHLRGYECRVVVDWRELSDDQDWSALAADLAGRSVPDLGAALDALTAASTAEPEASP